MKHLAFLFFLAGCADEYSLSVEEEFTNEEVQMITSAVDEWMTACDCYDASVFFRFDLKTTTNLQYSDWKDRKTYGRVWKTGSSENAYLEVKERKNTKFRGLHQNGNIMMVSDHLRGDTFYVVILHELGHMYGIEHQESGLMGIGPQDAKDNGCIDWRAISEFCDMHKCGNRAHPTCKE